MTYPGAPTDGNVDAQEGPKRRLASMVSIRLSPEENRAIRAQAEASGDSVSNYIRQRVLKSAGLTAGPISSTQSNTTSNLVPFYYSEGGQLAGGNAAPTAAVSMVMSATLADDLD